MSKSSRNPHGIVVGQVLCWARPDMRTGVPRAVDVRIVSVGRNYARLDYGSMRADLRTLRVSDLRSRESIGYGDGVCHLFREVWEQTQAVEHAWDRFRCAVGTRRQPPDNLALDRLVQAQILLGI